MEASNPLAEPGNAISEEERVTELKQEAAAVEEEEDVQQEEDDGVYLVPYSWLRESQESSSSDGGNSKGILFTASPAPPAYGGPMKIINNLFNSDLVFNLRRCGNSDDNAAPGDSDEASASSRCYALIRTDMWFRALKWHSDSSLRNTACNSWSADDGTPDVYAINLRISVAQETNVMTVKISKKDNTVEYYKRASKIFSVDSDQVRIWDFSGQTTLIFMNEINKLHRESPCQADQEIILELHVYALSEFLACEGKKDDLGGQPFKKFSSSCGSLLSNGHMGITDSDSVLANTASLSGCSRDIGSLGLTGLENLGNTCFMNSALQCLAHTPKLVDYFLGDYRREINSHNPLGMNGELALAFGELLRKLWAPERTPVVPKLFKTKLARFAPQFSGFNQHDSQELLAFLLDGLHEDLNRVKRKPYVEVKDTPDHPDEEVADEYWRNHLARNDSIIVDICQGQYRSTLVCPACSKVSVTFDPFMYLSLPLPSTTMRTMTLTVFSCDGVAKPSPYTITVPKYGKCKDLMESLSVACSLRDDESLLIAEVYSNRIIRYLEEPSDSLSLIRDGDRLAAFRLPKDLESYPLVVFMHQHMGEHDIHGKMISHSKTFGVPLITSLPNIPNGSTILNLFLKLLNPFLRSVDASTADEDNGGNNTSDIINMDITSPTAEFSVPADMGVVDNKVHLENELRFYITDERGQKMHSKIELNEEIPTSGLQKQLHVIVFWSQKVLEKYDTSLLNNLPEIYKSGLFFAKRPQDSVSLHSCLDAFLKEEPLGPEDMWYCPSCKTHRQASKKLDLWRLPEVLVIHLKRFSYSRFMKNKLETFVDFPIHNLDLSNYIAGKNEQQSHCYKLFAVSNHYGSMGGGHYTAYVLHAGKKQWYDFDDRHVSSISEDSVKTSAAYVLFYKRTQSSDINT